MRYFRSAQLRSSASARRLLALAALIAALVAPERRVWLRAEEGPDMGLPSLDPPLLEAPIRLEVQPSHIELQAARQTWRLIVTGHFSDGRTQDLTRLAEMTSAHEAIAHVDQGVVLPKADGTTAVTVRVGELTASTTVSASNMGLADPVSFRHEAIALLTRQGCNSGACHGSPKGKGGFRLSLQAYDPDLDEHTLIREHYGRRTNVLSPADSLLLMKPTLQVAHGGGLRLRPSDPAYATFAQWIAEGRRVDGSTAPTCVGLEILPGPRRLLHWPVRAQQLAAVAHFSDGSVCDVTRLARFSSSDEAIATVQPDGLVAGVDRGECAILVRYLDQLESVVFTFVKKVDGFEWNDPPENNYVDALVHKKLRQLRFMPSRTCSDGEFVRRIYLDVLGHLPEVEETRRFLDDPASDKRARLIDSLLERPEYAGYWALHWGDLLRLKERNMTAGGVHKFYAWLVAAVERNMPYDQFARALLTAEGSTYANPPANYYRTLEDSTACVESTAQLFMGVRIQCAKCHNHPFERWTQDNYYGLSAFFQRVQRKPGRREGEVVVWSSREGEVTHPRTGRQMKPWLPMRGIVDDAPDGERRQAFAAWLTQPDNPFFAKVAVNRMWAHLLGRGLVEPIDDFRESNPPANVELLDALAHEFRTSGFDQKRMLRTILNSRTYQRSAEANDFNRDDQKYFSRAQVRFLTAEQLLDAVSQVCAVPDDFAGMPPGTRPTQLPSPDVKHEFLKLFGQPERDTACACERSAESNLSQALELFSGPMLHAKLQHPENRFRRRMESALGDDAIVDELYLAALCRRPSPQELSAARAYLEQRPERGAAFEDVCWSLMNTNEFLFQH